jgi:hypothetical protein
MSNGGGQFTELRAVTSTGAVSPLAKLYHYAEGTSNDKDIYSDEAMTTAVAQPFVSDTAGRFHFYAQGDYKFVIKTAAGATLDTWDEYHISKGQPFITDWSDTLPAATTANKGHGYVRIASNILRQFAINPHDSWVNVFAANASGNQTIDSMVALSYPWYDITHGDYGAIAGEALDQTSRIQAAVDAVESAGGGAILVNGEFQVDGTLDINNTSIIWLGLGGGKSVLKQTVNPTTPMIDYDTDDVADFFAMRGIDLVTEVVGSNTAIDCKWPTTSGEDSKKNLSLSDMYIGPSASTLATAYFSNTIILEDAKKGSINDVFVRGHNSLDSAMNGLLLNGYCEDMTLVNYKAHHSLTGLETTTNVSRTILVSCGFKGQTQGILLGGCDGFKVTASWFEKEADSTVDWFGIRGDSANISISGGNSFKDLGSASGTDTGVKLDTAVLGQVSNNIFDTLDKGIETTANTTSVHLTENTFNSVTTPITNVNASNQVRDNVPAVWATVASADPLVGSNATDLWEVTGTTNFDEISSTNAREGRRVTLRMSDASGVTIADNTGNFLMAGVFTPAKDQAILELIYDATLTKWVETNRAANWT